MQTMKAPPVLKSTSASGRVQPSGLNRRLICSAPLHALKTSSRGAGNARETTKGSGFKPEDSRGFAIFASFFGDLFEIGAEPIEPALPFEASCADPLLRLAERAGLDPAGADAAEFLADDETGPFEHRQVLGYRGERHRQGTRQLADAGGAERQTLDDSPPRRIGERLKCEIESVGSVKHLLLYRSANRKARAKVIGGGARGPLPPLAERWRDRASKDGAG